MSREKQIEEIAKDYANIAHQNFLDYWAWVRCDGKRPLPRDEYIATGLYEAGYRKQSEGKWKPIVKCNTSTKTLIYYQCSLCGVYLASEANFCPNCGAKMKGGAE